MSLFSYNNLKKILFKLDPETAHSIAGFGLRTISHCPMIQRYVKDQNFVTDPMIQQEIFGKRFQNPVGLGAGFDKDGQYITHYVGQTPEEMIESDIKKALGK